MASVHDLINSLSGSQQSAIGIVRLALDCFNGADGTGLFKGVERYNVLAGRVEICAVQADSLPRFWALLLRRMQWPVPPKGADQAIVDALSVGSPSDVLRALATETASIITLARMAHDHGKAARKALRRESDTEDFGPEAGNLENLV